VLSNNEFFGKSGKSISTILNALSNFGKITGMVARAIFYLLRARRNIRKKKKMREAKLA